MNRYCESKTQSFPMEMENVEVG